MAKDETLDEISNISIDRWTQSTPFMDAFNSHEIASSRFTRLFPLFLITYLDETANGWHLTTKTKRLPSAVCSNSCPYSPASLSSIDKSSHRKIARETMMRARKQRRIVKSKIWKIGTILQVQFMTLAQHLPPMALPSRTFSVVTVSKLSKICLW